MRRQKKYVVCYQIPVKRQKVRTSFKIITIKSQSMIYYQFRVLRPFLDLYFQIEYLNMSKLTLINIQPNQTDQALMNFALLQIQLKDGLPDLPKMDEILFQLYNNYCNLKESQSKSMFNANNLVSQCNETMINFKQDQEELLKLSQDRLRLVGELRQSTDFSLQLLQENKQLKEMMAAMQRLNDLLNLRHAQMQGQLSKLIQKEKNSLKNEINGLQKDYQAMFQQNQSIKSDVEQLSKRAEILKQLSLPIRVIKVAFNSNRSLRELVMRQAQTELGNNSELRNIFMKCQFQLQETKN